MKNLFAIPRLSLSETFTILITLVVCLVGFTSAEVYSDYRKRNPNEKENENVLQKSSYRESVPYARETSKRSKDSGGRNFANLRNLLEFPLDKRDSDYFGEFERADGEKETDGYGYDDDEYYHFNFKRNDDKVGNNDNAKSEKQARDKSNDKEAASDGKLHSSAQKDADKDSQTGEALDPKESHVNSGETKNQKSPQFSDENQSKQKEGKVDSSLKMSDLKENSAADEKVKDRKELGRALAGQDKKLVEGKNSLKADNEEALKPNDKKASADSEKKDKDVSSKDAKDKVGTKALKGTREKERNVRLNEEVEAESADSAVERQGKEPGKAARDEEETAGYGDGLPDASSGFSFSSNYYKDNADDLKPKGTEDEKNSYEEAEMNKNTGRACYPDEKQSRDRVKKHNVKENFAGERREASNRQENDAESLQDASQTNIFSSRSRNYETANANPKQLLKTQFWREVGLQDTKRRQRKQAQEQISEEPQRPLGKQMTSRAQMQSYRIPGLVFDTPVENPYAFKLPAESYQNIDYPKNYLKLKRCQSLSEGTNGVPRLPAGFDSLEKLGQERGKNLEAKNRRSMVQGEIPEGNEKTQNKYSGKKRDVHGSPSGQFRQSRFHSPYEHSSSVRTAKSGSNLGEAGGQEQQEGFRLRRKSPQKFEYEIKVINQNKDEGREEEELPHYSLGRVEKDLKSKLSSDDKYSKKRAYSPSSADSLVRSNTIREPENYKKIKRKAPTTKTHEEKFNIQTREVPFGYYGNRVKFVQKFKDNDRVHPEVELNPFALACIKGQGSRDVDMTQYLRSKDMTEDDFTHDPSKRFDDDRYPKNMNALLLVKKGEEMAKSLEEGNTPPVKEKDLTSDVLAKLLSRDKDFLILKRTENNKFQKISDSDNFPGDRAESDGSQTPGDISFAEKADSLKNSLKQSMLKKGLQTRSFHSEKDDKKYTPNFHGTTSKSNLKKTFEKFRDFAGFFKENEQESVENPMREVKEGRDIVFSEDKLPDPIVINNDSGEKYTPFKVKSQNSIFSISTNFKALDQQDKKKELQSNLANHNTLVLSAPKTDGSENSWEPALRNLFPEAKSVNSTTRDGNEIIVLDLNRNQLSSDYRKPSGKQPYGPFGANQFSSSVNQFSSNNNNNQFPNNNVQFPFSNNQLPVSNNQLPVSSNQLPTSNKMMSIPLTNNDVLTPNNRRVQIVIQDDSSLQQAVFPSSHTPGRNSYLGNSNVKANDDDDLRTYSMFRNGDVQPQIMLPSPELNHLSSLIKNVFDQKESNRKIAKKSVQSGEENNLTDNFNTFLKDLDELSQLTRKDNRKRGLSGRTNADSDDTQEASLDSEFAIKYLGSLLQNILAASESQDKDKNGQQNPPGSGETYSENGADGSLRRWSSGDENRRDFASDEKDNGLDLQKEISEPTKDKSSEDELWEELAMSPDQIHRTRRRDKGKKKRKATESRHQGALPDSKSEVGLSDLSFVDSKESEKMKNKKRNDMNWVSQLKTNEASKDDSGMKSENQFDELIEDPRESKNEKEQLIAPTENGWSRKKRKDTRRRKRSARNDVKNKVSTTAVQNTILKNLAEDNYHSVYSPGIKRRLLSTKIEAEDADSYNDANEPDKKVIVEEPQEMCVKNTLNKCTDPLIIELFADDGEQENNRTRRSLTRDFHSDFKREIDLDESMPNDFQNFLVTSLGAFGSQKREVVKKDEALEGEKGLYPDGYNRMTEGDKEASEDSALDKRELPPEEEQPVSSYKNLGDSESPFYSNPGRLKAAERTARDDGKSNLKARTSWTVSENLPTQIQIKITNGGGKDKKSFKPITEDSKTISAEVERFPKEKEFFDKGKSSSDRKNSNSKFNHFSLSSFNANDFQEDEDQGNRATEVHHRLHKQKLKKDKFNSDGLLKPAKYSPKFDYKALENAYKSARPEFNSAAEKTKQKNSVSHFLPQIETVYNPTQGTNKAQLESDRLAKIISAINKNTARAKSSQESFGSIGNNKISRSYLREKLEKAKPGKAKNVEGQKPLTSKLGSDQSVNVMAPYTFHTYADTFINLYKQKYSPARHNSGAVSSKLLIPFPKGLATPANPFDALPTKQGSANRNTDNEDQKIFQNQELPFAYLFKKPEKTKPHDMPSKGVKIGNLYSSDFSRYKRPLLQGRKHLAPGFRGKMEGKYKTDHARKYEGEKLPSLEATQGLRLQGLNLENYPDTLDDDYGEDYAEDYAYDYVAGDPSKELEFEKQLGKYNLKKPHFYDFPLHYLYAGKNSDLLEQPDQEEMNEDYNENAEDEDFGDYSRLANEKALEDPLFTPSPLGDEKSQGIIRKNPLTTASHPPKTSPLRVKFSFPGQLTKSKSESNPVATSSELLKKINENSDILGKNLMQNLYGPKYEGVLGSGTAQPPKRGKGELLAHDRKQSKKKFDSRVKLKRSREMPEIEDRYTEGTKLGDLSKLKHPSNLRQLKQSTNNNYRLAKGHFLDAEFAGPGNDFESESEEKGKYFNDLNGFSKHERDTDEELDEAEVLKENLEDDEDETMSEDNVLENVIGKYIMRKTVSTDQDSKRSAGKEKTQEDEPGRRKRSADFSERTLRARVLRKRFSSGHLTESNFRKYHKKNFTGKRQADSGPDASVFDDAMTEGESEVQAKRSALDLLKRLTSKEKDKKPEVDAASRTAGFEPLAPLKDKKQSSEANNKAALANQEKKFANEAVQGQAKNNLREPKLPLRISEFFSNEPSPGKSNTGRTESFSPRMQGPWKVELDDKSYPMISQKGLGKGYNLEELKGLSGEAQFKGLKTYLVISPQTAKRNSEVALSSIPGLFLRKPESEEVIEISKKYVRRREPSADRTEERYEDPVERSNGKEPIKNADEPDTELRYGESLAEGDSRQTLQINPKMSFVTVEGQSLTSPSLSKERLVKQKSAFPPPNDANIMRDNRHVNEETSEYLGHQVVNAILSHVNANPKFKEMIAPALDRRTPAFRQESYDEDNTLRQGDISDQFQYFLQRFMYDLEKLAESRVKKRMCNKIDKQAKEFLEFLLAVPVENGKIKADRNDLPPDSTTAPILDENDSEDENEFYGASAQGDPPDPNAKPPEEKNNTTKTPQEWNPDGTSKPSPKQPQPAPPEDPDCLAKQDKKGESYKDLAYEIESLKKKCCLLLKLIVDYQNLSKLEKEILDAKYHSIMQQLGRINQHLRVSKDHQEPEPSENQAERAPNYPRNSYEIKLNQEPRNYDNKSKGFQATETGRRNKKAKHFHKGMIPKLLVEEVKNPAEADVATWTSVPVFESVTVGKLSDIRHQSKGKPQTLFQIDSPKIFDPNSFGLLLCSNDTEVSSSKKGSKTAKDSSIYQSITGHSIIFKPVPSESPAPAPSGLQPMIMKSTSAKISGSHSRPSGQIHDGERQKKYGPGLQGRRKKRSKRKNEIERSGFAAPTEGSGGGHEEESTGWSSVPAVRQMLLNLESGVEFDGLLLERPPKKKMKRREKRPE